MTIRIGRAVGLVAFAAILATLSSSCASTQKKETPIQTQTVEEYEANTPEPDDPCLGTGGNPVECTDASDCCKGMVCSLDPDRSHVRRYCLSG
jgi:hypothetical protein